MNGVFCWKKSSDQILRECFNNTISVRDEDDHCSEEDEDDLATTDNSIFEMACINRELALQLQPELDTHMQQWRELTNIDTSPDLSRKESLYVDNTCVQSHDENETITNSPSNYVVEEQREEKNSDQTNKNSDKKTKQFQMKFRVQYPFISKRVRATIAGAIDFFKDTISAKDISVDSEVYLMPGNVQQRVTSLRIGSMNPVLNSVEYFKGHSGQDVYEMRLRIKVNGSCGENGV